MGAQRPKQRRTDGWMKWKQQSERHSEKVLVGNVQCACVGEHGRRMQYEGGDKIKLEFHRKNSTQKTR